MMIEKFFECNDEKIHEILDCVNVGIWILEYSKEKNIYRFYGNRTLARMMGLKEEYAEKLSPVQWYEYWHKRIDLNCLDCIEEMIDNIIFMFDYKIEEPIMEEVCYIWNHDLKGQVSIRCGGRVVDKKDNVYKICGYCQDYTNIIKLRDCIKNEGNLTQVEYLKNINYLKEYYKELAHVDELTGILNRRGFFSKINRIIENRMRRYSDNLWLAMIDLDFFKKINDVFGHLSGDKVLKYIGAILKDLEKQNKRVYVFRYGGEEFIVLLYRYDFDEVKMILDDLRKSIENAQISIERGKCIQITCSIGVACLKKKKGIDVKSQKLIYDAIQRADIALYKAKNSGKNRIDFEM